MKITKHTQVIIIGIVLIAALSLYISHSLKQKPKVTFITVQKTDVTQAVKSSGMVKASQDLALNFQVGGIVSQVNVKEGDMVKKGQVLVRLDTRDSSAGLSQASAALAVAQANYEKVLQGATSQQIDVAKAAVLSAQTSLNNANNNLITIKSQQDTAVQSALSTLLNTSFSVVPGSSNSDSVIPTITGTYTGTDQGVYNISVYATGSGLKFQVSGLETSSGDLRAAPVALGTKGLFIQFNTAPGTSDTWTASIPNTYAPSYVTNYNTYQAALKTHDVQIAAAQAQVSSAQSALAQAQANLQLQQSAARPEDIAAAQAQVATASAQLQAAQNAYSKSMLLAPIDGIITSVNTKIGQTVAGSTLAPGAPIIKMISNQKFQIETYISEADVANIQVNDPATASLDAYGSNISFDASVIAIDPAATVQNGGSTYKTTLEFKQEDSRIKSGMGASVIITHSVHKNVLAIPSTAVIKKNNQEFVLVDQGNGQTRESQIQTGVSSLDGLVEVVSGLSQGQKIASFGNQ